MDRFATKVANRCPSDMSCIQARASVQPVCCKPGSSLNAKCTVIYTRSVDIHDHIGIQYHVGDHVLEHTIHIKVSLFHFLLSLSFVATVAVGRLLRVKGSVQQRGRHKLVNLHKIKVVQSLHKPFVQHSLVSLTIIGCALRALPDGQCG